MSGWKSVMKEGYHPKGKDGGKESWRGDFKGINQVAGWVGHGKKSEQQRSEHVSRPLASLKDPAAFGPPPKNINYHGAAAVPDRITPDPRGLGRPLSQAELQAAQQSRIEPEPQSSRPAPPPVPYRANTSGLSTEHLPPPPIHRNIAGSASQSTANGQTSRAKPSLPPRLPPRQNSTPMQEPDEAPPAYEATKSPSPVSLPPASTPPAASTSNGGSYLNRGAVGRLGKAGISVPGLGIGEQSNPWKTERTQSSTSTSSNGSHLNQFQQRFSQMNTSGASAQPEASQPPAQGTTWAQKQSAMQTAQNFHKDPSSVSMQDARQAASTANNFRERHGEQIKAASSRANELNKKHNITSRINNFLETQASPSDEQPPQTPGGGQSPFAGNQSTQSQALNGRKPPPPPPPKKPASMSSHLGSGSGSGNGAAPPPPVPLGTKPR